MVVRAVLPVLPRVAAATVLGVVLQRHVRRSGKGSPSHFTNSTHYASALSSARAALVPKEAVPLSLGASLSGVSSSSSSLVRTALQLLKSLWLSVAIGAAASWAAVNATMMSTLKQLKMASPTALADADMLDRCAVEQFVGEWVKVGATSESMEPFCELFGVPRWLRRATRLMTGLQICMTDDALIIKQVCKLSWLSAVETFPLDGSCSKPMKRRDMRGGKQTGKLLAAQDGSVTVSVAWQGYLSGRAVDVLQLQQTPQGPVLVVAHQAQVEGRGTAQFKEVFKSASN